jgi:hypothetical protein
LVSDIRRDKPVEVEFLGWEEEGELIYTYLQVETRNPDRLALRFVSLMEYFKGQKNVVHYKEGSYRKTLFFRNSETPTQKIYE